RDADDEIEKAAAMPISEIFERFGEAYFREGERRVIARLLADRPHVLATGGGAYLDPETRRLLSRRAITVWLRVDLDTLVRRTERRDHRPLLKGRDTRAVLSDLIDARYPIYAEADIVVDSRDEPHETMVREIVERLEAFDGVVAAE
ncbi:MAG: shikimate kinase, partial [Pseudomonadota bacterium]